MRTSLVDWSWLALPYVLLVVTFGLGLADGSVAANLPAAIGLCAFVATWHWWWAIRHRHWLGEAAAPMAVYFLGLLTATALLSLVSFAFFPLYLLGFAIAFVALPGGWAFAGLVLTAVVSFTPRLVTPTFDNVAAIIGGGVLAGLAGWSIRALDRSQADLRQALAQNHELQEQLVAEARDAGVTAERSRLAAEFHDSVAADLTGIIGQLEALDSRLDPGHPQRHRVASALAAARDGLAETRAAVHALRPAALDERSLPAALAVVVGRFRRAGRTPVVLRVTGTEDDIPVATAHALLRAGQEALTNAAEHAEAATVHVTLSYLGDAVALDVADDGRGVAPGRRVTSGQGLQIMRERVAAVGGRVVLDSMAGQGTTVTVTVPLDGAGPLGEGADGAAPAEEGAGERWPGARGAVRP